MDKDIQYALIQQSTIGSFIFIVLDLHKNFSVKQMRIKDSNPMILCSNSFVINAHDLNDIKSAKYACFPSKDKSWQRLNKGKLSKRNRR